jgi:ATP-dependent 26S proteasome regulatory subunit
MQFQEELSYYIRAGYPLLYITALEPERAMASIEKVCSSIGNGGVSCHQWKVTTGWDLSGEGDDPDEVFEYIDKRQAFNSVSVLCNYHSYIGENPNPVLIQRFMDSYFTWKAKETHRTVIILSPMFKLAPELERFFQTMTYSLPNIEQITATVDTLADGYKDRFTWESEKHRDRVIANASGMTEDEIESSLALSVVKTNAETGKPSIDPDIVMDEKAKILSKSGFLEYWPYPEDLSSVGGLNNLKAWLKEREKAIFSPKAKEFGLPQPKGLFLLGLPGTGKSLAAKCLSKEWGLPLIRFDMGKVFGSLVGESEERMRMVLNQMESLAPAAVWIDEIEKGMAGAESSGTMDSGVTKRVFGQLLTWMEERPKDKLIYIIATANEALSLPAALLRRFDTLFWVDLPTEKDRAEILRIHLNKNNQMSEEVEAAMGRLCEVTRGFSGAEIENVVHSSMFKAFSADADKVTPAHLEAAALTITPIAKLRREDIEASRMWAKERCQFAQDEEPVNLDSLHQDRVRLVQSRSINLN